MRIWLVVGACLGIAGCAAGTRAVFPQRYTLRAAAPTVQQSRTAPAGTATLAIARIAAPAWLQGTDIHYRLQYRHADTVAAYADSVWAAPPPQMLARGLQSQLAASGAWRAVVGIDAGATTTYRLQVRLDDFTQVFTRPGQSHAALDATVTLIAGADDAAVAQTRIRLMVPAASANAAGGVAALNTASAEFATQVQAWLQHVVPRASAPR